LPCGAFLTARRFGEKSLLRAAYALERLTRARRNPLSV